MARLRRFLPRTRRGIWRGACLDRSALRTARELFLSARGALFWCGIGTLPEFGRCRAGEWARMKRWKKPPRGKFWKKRGLRAIHSAGSWALITDLWASGTRSRFFLREILAAILNFPQVLKLWSGDFLNLIICQKRSRRQTAGGLKRILMESGRKRVYGKK